MRWSTFYVDLIKTYSLSLCFDLSFSSKRRFENKCSFSLFSFLNNDLFRLKTADLLIRTDDKNRLYIRRHAQFSDCFHSKNHHANTRFHVKSTRPFYYIIFNGERHFVECSGTPYSINMSDQKLVWGIRIKIFRFANKLARRS